MKIEESEFVKKVLEGLAESTKMGYKSTLRQFVRFVNSKEGLSKEISIDDVVEEVKTDAKRAEWYIDSFYKWVQNKEVKGYILRGKLKDKKGKPLKLVRQSSAFQKSYSHLMGFFVNLNIAFERKWRKKIPKPERKQAIKKDSVYTFYEVDDKSRSIRFNRELMQQFLSNLKLRDQAITLALLSSSQDSGDLFRLNVEDVRQQKNHRIFWEGKRQKSGILFRTFFSKEATRFVLKYLEQQRQNAGDKEPLFTARGKRMTPHNIASVYRDTARKMNIKWDSGEFNPLRPKRMRGLFRSACDTAGITELYTNAFMGHKNNQGQDYSELSRAVLELEYLRLEPFLTVYGEVEESLEIKEDVSRLESKIVDLNTEIQRQKRVIEDLSNIMNSKIEAVTARIQTEHFRKIFEENYGITIRELQQFCRQMRKKKQNSSEP